MTFASAVYTAGQQPARCRALTANIIAAPARYRPAYASADDATLPTLQFSLWFPFGFCIQFHWIGPAIVAPLNATGPCDVTSNCRICCWFASTLPAPRRFFSVRPGLAAATPAAPLARFWLFSSMRI